MKKIKSSRDVLHGSSPYSKENKRISIILSQCRNIQEELVGTWKVICKGSQTSRNLADNIKKIAKRGYVNNNFLSEYAKKKKHLELTKKNEVSELAKKIDSALKSPRIYEKFSLKRSDKKYISKIPEKVFIEAEEIIIPEAQMILKKNKREFGGCFPKETILRLEKNVKKKILDKKYDNKNSISFSQSKKELGEKLRLNSGAFSQMKYPYSSKKNLNNEDKELLENIINEKLNIQERNIVQKYISGKTHKRKLL